MDLPWSERVNMLSVNPDVATREDIAQMATELSSHLANIPPTIDAAKCLTCMYGPYCDCDMLCSRAVVVEDKYKLREVKP